MVLPLLYFKISEKDLSRLYVGLKAVGTVRAI